MPAVYARPLIHATPSDRVTYLQRVLLWTTGGLTIAAGSGIASAVVLYVLAAAGVTFLVSGFFPLVVILGCFGVAHYLCPRLVFGDAKVLGFGLASTLQGIAMGFLLLQAFLMGAAAGNPLGLVVNALLLTGLTGAGMVAYVMTKPREFKMIGAGLSALGLPMLILMGASIVFPGLFGGPIGLLISVAFVVISAAGLLYQVNVVLHRLSTDQHIEGSYLITMGVLILYWNILSLLMTLNRD